MENKMTAVMWLIRNVNENIPPYYIPKEVVNIAIQMEKQQIKDALEAGMNKNYYDADFFSENYYKIKYGK